MKFSHTVCPTCFSVGLNIDVGNAGKCSICETMDQNRLTDCDFLPTWTNENNEKQYHIPVELESLSIAEKLLIQLVSPLVPLKHIKNVVFGLS